MILNKTGALFLHHNNTYMIVPELSANNPLAGHAIPKCRVELSRRRAVSAEKVHNRHVSARGRTIVWKLVR